MMMKEDAIWVLPGVNGVFRGFCSIMIYHKMMARWTGKWMDIFVCIFFFSRNRNGRSCL